MEPQQAWKKPTRVLAPLLSSFDFSSLSESSSCPLPVGSSHHRKGDWTAGLAGRRPSSRCWASRRKWCVSSVATRIALTNGRAMQLIIDNSGGLVAECINVLKYKGRQGHARIGASLSVSAISA